MVIHFKQKKNLKFTWNHKKHKGQPKNSEQKEFWGEILLGLIPNCTTDFSKKITAQAQKTHIVVSRQELRTHILPYTTKAT